MKIFIDTADVKIIKEFYKKYQFDGVTTNPRLLSRICGRPMDILKDIKKTIPEESELHVQVVSLNANQMIKEAEYILRELGTNIHIKVPVSEEGYSVIRHLAQRGISVTATTIFHPIQALLASQHGATSVAPYVRQISNKCHDGVEVAKEIQKLIIANGYKTELLAAAFDSVNQVTEIAKIGSKSITVSPDILLEMMQNSNTEGTVKKFQEEFRQSFRQDSLLL